MALLPTSNISSIVCFRDTPQKASTIIPVEYCSDINRAICLAIPSGVTLYQASLSIQIPSSYLENSRYRCPQYLHINIDGKTTRYFCNSAGKVLCVYCTFVLVLSGDNWPDIALLDFLFVI